MQYIGITERNAFKRFQLQNKIYYEKSLVQLKDDNQMLIFVHSCAEIGKVAEALHDMALDQVKLPMFMWDGSGTQEILLEESALTKK